MKKNLIFILVLITSSMGFSQNLDFEDWVSNTVTILDDYETMTMYEPIDGASTCIQSIDYYSGTYSLRLETILTSGNDTLFGYFANGDPETMDGGNELNTLTAVDSICGYYKYDVQPDDTALILCVPKYNGTPTGGSVYTITGTQSTWKRFSYPVEAIIADSFIVAAASSNAINGVGIAPGSYLMLDSVFLKHNTQGVEYIPNHSFENWSDIIWEDLDKWTTYNKYFIFQPIMSVAKTTDAYTGSFASVLTTTVLNGTDTVPGAMTYGEWTMSGPIGGVPYSGDPELIRFYYKSNIVGLDTAIVQFAFKNNGNVNDFYGAEILTNEIAYTLYEIPVSLSQTPDTVFLYVKAGENPGSEFTIDDIEFVLPLGVAETYKINEVVAFPVPATDKLNFEINSINTNSVLISIYSISGKLISITNFDDVLYNQKLSVDISSLQKGNYFYKIEINNEIYSKAFVKN